MKPVVTKICFLLLVLTLACSQDEPVLDELANSDWRVLSIVDKEDQTQLLPVYGYILRLNTEGQLYYNLDVNNCSAMYQRNAEGITIADQSCQERCCDTDYAVQLQALIPTVTTFKVEEDNLTLIGEKDIVFEKLPSCDGVACQKYWEYIHLNIRTRAGTPAYLTKVKLVRKEDGATLYESNVIEGYAGFEYTLIDDGFQKTFRNKRVVISFLGYRNDELLVNHDFVVTADCCHVSVVEGALQVVID